MRTLVIGSGGREHALINALAHDPAIDELHAAPGNAGIARQATCHPEAGPIDNAVAMVTLAEEIQAELVVIGPEAPLVSGVSDALREAGFAVFGPSAAAARLEGSKAFAKQVMKDAGVATATADELNPGVSDAEIEEILDRYGPIWVVKDDGLAGGKGVVVTPERTAARAHVDAVLAAGNPVLLETFLDGPEVSLFCLVDGETVVPLLPAQDHKRAYDHDEGPNTGGMGAYTPLDWLPEGATQTLVDDLVAPVAREMVRRGTPYSGLLYLGAAWGAKGPAVVEFNARFGDPETQPILSLLKTPLGEVLHATATGRLSEIGPLDWADEYAVTVVVAAKNYPISPVKGGEITGEGLDDPAVVLHAGTSRDAEGRLIASGGRVLNIMGRGKTLVQAREEVYRNVDKLQLEGSFTRSDIARKAVEGEIRIPE